MARGAPVAAAERVSLSAILVSVWCLFWEGTSEHQGDYRDFTDSA